MASPFDFLTNMFSPSSAEAAEPGAVGPNSPFNAGAPNLRVLPSSNPLEPLSLVDRIFDPSRNMYPTDVLTAPIGRFLGLQTAQERQGRIQAEVMAEAARLREQGMSPDRVVLNLFTKSDVGKRAMGTGAFDLKRFLDDFMQATVPPKPDYVPTAPGYKTTITPQPGQPGAPAGMTEITNPPANVQHWQSMREIANLPQEVLQQLATDQLLTPERRATKEAERAWDDLIKADPKNELLYMKLKTGQHGAIRVIPKTDQFGTQNGVVIYDMVNQRAIEVPQNRVMEQIGPRGENIPTDAKNPDGTVDATKLWPSSKSVNMFLGSGVLPTMIGTIGSIVGQIDPRLQTQKAEEINQQRAAMVQAEQAVHSLVSSGGALGIPKDQIAIIQDLFSPRRFLRSAKDNVNSAVQLKAMAVDRHNGLIAEINDPRTSNEARKKASEQAMLWRKIHDALPDHKEMVQWRDAINSGQIQVPGLGDLFDAVTMGAAGAKAAVSQATGQPNQEMIALLKRIETASPAQIQAFMQAPNRPRSPEVTNAIEQRLLQLRGTSPAPAAPAAPPAAPIQRGDRLTPARPAPAPSVPSGIPYTQPQRAPSAQEFMADPGRYMPPGVTPEQARIPTVGPVVRPRNLERERKSSPFFRRKAKED